MYRARRSVINVEYKICIQNPLTQRFAVPSVQREVTVCTWVIWDMHEIPSSVAVIVSGEFPKSSERQTYLTKIQFMHLKSKNKTQQ